MLIGVEAQGGLSPLELSDQLQRIRPPQIEQLSGVAQVSLLGISKEEIQVLFDPEYLNEINLTPVILQQLIAYQNIVVPGGGGHRGKFPLHDASGQSNQQRGRIRTYYCGYAAKQRPSKLWGPNTLPHLFR